MIALDEKLRFFNSFLSKDFLYGVIGASPIKEKYGYIVFRKLLDRGFNAVPVNPFYEEVDGIKTVPNVCMMEKKPDVIVTVVRPEVTSKVVPKAIKCGIKRVWMQPGSQSDEAIEACKKAGIPYVAGECIMIAMDILDY